MTTMNQFNALTIGNNSSIVVATTNKPLKIDMNMLKFFNDNQIFRSNEDATEHMENFK